MFKRGGVWWTHIRFNGKEIQKSLETTDKKLASIIEVKIKNQIIEGKFCEFNEGKYLTFKHLTEKYLAECSIRKSLKSQIRDKGIFNNHMIPFFGEMYLEDIASKHISQYKFKRQKAGATSDTINKELGLLKAAFNVAIKEWEWLSNNPVNKVRMEKQGKGRVRFLNEMDFNHLLSSCPDWLKPIILVAKLTGLRQGNLLSLEWKQIDLIQRMIIIEQTKNGDRLGLPICNFLYNLLLELKLKSNQSNLVFSDVLDGMKIYPIKIYRAFKQSCKKAGIENFRFHDLRHCFASQLVQNNVDLFRVQRLLGHKDSRMTQRYAHLTSENLQLAVKVFDKIGYNLATVGEFEKH